jgi:hypothetical protein
MVQQEYIHVLEIVPCSEYVSTGYTPVGSGKCQCEKWQTTDNLEWLEQKAQEKESGS